MKNSFMLLFLVAAFIHLVEVTAQQPAPPWFIVFEESVSPSNMPRFMEVQTEAVDLWKKHKLDIPVYSYLNDENTFYWVVPITNFASIDTLYQKMGKMSQKLKAEGYDGAAKFRDLSTVSTTVVSWVPEMSYHYSGSLVQDPNKPYVEWMFVHLLSGHEEEAAEALKKFRAYYVDNKLDYSWDAFRVLIGNDAPALIGQFREESQVILSEKNAKIWGQHGSELAKLWAEVSKHAWKIDNKTGRYHAQFSNVPLLAVPEPGE
jgi:hypothetical protein